MKRSITRRRLVSGATAFGLAGPALAAAPSSLPAQPSLLVAGPVSSRVDQWAHLIAPPLGQRLLGANTLSWDNVGGVDGVTGVNQFQARTSPDGATALLLPGTALLAWLVGDARVRFDAGAWAPLWGGSATAIVASRIPLAPGQRARIAVSDVACPELEALLALHMMGVEAIPVPKTGADALRQRDVDAVYLRGTPSRERLAAEGWRAAFSLTSPGLNRGRSPANPDLVPAHELFVPARAADLTAEAAFRAVSAAASLDVALVMPAVVPAAVLAWWRRGCEQLDEEPAVRQAAAAAGVRQDDAGAIAAQLSLISLDNGVILALRTLLAERYHWRPS